MELDDAAKAKRYKELEQILGKLKPGDEVSLLLYNGDTTEGIFYSYLDGFVSLRMDDAFRDTELADVRGISIQPKDRMKAVTMGLIFASIAGIVITFIVTH